MNSFVIKNLSPPAFHSPDQNLLQKKAVDNYQNLLQNHRRKERADNRQNHRQNHLYTEKVLLPCLGYY